MFQQGGCVESVQLEEQRRGTGEGKRKWRAAMAEIQERQELSQGVEKKRAAARQDELQKRRAKGASGVAAAVAAIAARVAQVRAEVAGRAEIHAVQVLKEVDWATVRIGQCRLKAEMMRLVRDGVLEATGTLDEWVLRWSEAAYMMPWLEGAATEVCKECWRVVIEHEEAQGGGGGGDRGPSGKKEKGRRGK
jgi:hypothetical protein